MRLDGFSIGATSVLALRVRTHLCQIVGHATPITYQALAKALGLVPPNTIHQLTIALECLIEEDAAAARPLIAALVVSKARGGLPAPGFFDYARRAARFDGEHQGKPSHRLHANDCRAANDFVIHAVDPGLPLADQFRLKASVHCLTDDACIAKKGGCAGCQSAPPRHCPSALCASPCVGWIAG